MNNKFIFTVVAAVVLAGGCGTIGVPRTDLLGSLVANTSPANQTIAITPQTRHVHVVGGDVVRFTVGDKSFVISFDGPIDIVAFELNRLAPPGMLDHTVIAHVQPNPIYIYP